MRENLKAARVEIGDGGFVLDRIPEEFAALRRIVGVGREHRGGMGLDHAVEHGFHDATRDPVVVVLFTGVFD